MKFDEIFHQPGPQFRVVIGQMDSTCVKKINPTDSRNDKSCNINHHETHERMMLPVALPFYGLQMAQLDRKISIATLVYQSDSIPRFGCGF